MVASRKLVTEPADRVLVMSRVFDAPRELVFKAWSSAAFLTKWFGPLHFKIPHCTVDFRVGGSYKLCMRAPDGTDYWTEGTYLEIDPPKKLAFTWERPEFKTDPPMVVTITLEEAGEFGKKTKLTLHQALFDATKDRDDHNQGWGECLEKLQAYVEADAK
jgi:uncharacterized protein YndB with AHSA1/START domain